MGVPAVVTDVGTGTVEAIAPGKTGLVVPPGNPAALAAAIKEIFADRLRGEMMGQHARERAVALHSVPRAADQLREIYARAVSSGANGGAQRPVN